MLLLLSLQCPIMFNPINGSPPGSAVPGILQARVLEWVAIAFSGAYNITPLKQVNRKEDTGKLIA